MSSTETAPGRNEAGPAATDRLDLAAVAAVVALVVVAGVGGRLLSNRGELIHAGAAPLQGRWEFHAGVGSLLAAVVALGVLSAARSWVHRASWPTLVGASIATSIAWIFSLTMVDGWSRGFADRLTRPDEYLTELPRITGLGDFLRTFNDSVPVDSADPWTTHVASHPPAVLAPFWLLDRIGLSGGGWAAALCVVVGASAVAAALITVRSLGEERTARRLAPFLVLSPAAIWGGVSADALFLGVSAWGVALLAVACRHETSVRSDLAAAAGGLLLATGLYLSYGLALSLVVAAGVVVCFGTVRVASWATGAALFVVTGFTLAGFSWLDGSKLVVERYYAGWGGQRPYTYWVWADIAVFALAIGPAAVVGAERLIRGTLGSHEPRWWHGPNRVVVVLVASAFVAVIVATLGGLSKGEVERIWLPFALWVTVSCAALPASRTTSWLTAQVLLALFIQHAVFTTW